MYGILDIYYIYLMYSLTQYDLQVFWVTSFGPLASHHQIYKVS